MVNFCFHLQPGLHCPKIVIFDGAEQGSATFTRRVHFGPISHQLPDDFDIAVAGRLNERKAATWREQCVPMAYVR